jgi:3-deoxy-D-manno-octulosonate 8-phosphate phosphatase (KDO 8-P phosphatase)
LTSAEELAEKLRKIRLVVFDVDGVLTDGAIVLDDRGGETKSFHVRDGTGIKYLVRAGVDVAFLSGRSSEVVRARASELGVKEMTLGALNKIDAYEALVKRMGLADDQVAYVGDDLPDLPVLARVGVAAAPRDAVAELDEALDTRLESAGGKGAAREFAEMVLKAQGKWRVIMERYLPGTGEEAAPGPEPFRQAQGPEHPRPELGSKAVEGLAEGGP